MDTFTNSYGMKSDAISSTPSMIPSVESSSSSSSFDKLVHFDSQAATKFFHNPDQKLNFSLQHNAVGAERAFSRSLNPVSSQMSWDHNYSIFPHFENKLFSSSLSDLLSQKLQPSSNNGTVASHSEEEEPFESLEEIEAQTIGNLLPDDDDLLSGVVDETEIFVQPSEENNLEDFDLFSSVGGMDLGDDTPSVGQRNSEFLGNSNKQLIGANTSLHGEHPYGEHPSRTLFVRNINSNVEDSELQSLFEQYGDIRSLYTACKHRGFVMISYFDIRAARTAMKELQNKPLRLRRLDIHYSIPKDNPSEKDVNQGTLVVLNLDSSVSNDDLQQIFGAYGEIKEVQGHPSRSNQRFIEFYDVRAADEALHALNGSDIAGKKIKVELSRTGGSRQSSTRPLALSSLVKEEPMQQSSAESLCGCINSTNMECNTGCGSNLGPFMESPTSHGISSSVPSGLPSLRRAESASSLVAPSEFQSSINRVKYEFEGLSTLNPRSLPEFQDGLANNMPATISSPPHKRAENIHLGRTSSFVDLCNGFATSRNGGGSLPEHHYTWSNSNHRQPPAFVWTNSHAFSNEFCSPQSQVQFHRLPRSSSHNSILPMHNHHVGSAPAVNPSFWDRRNLYSSGSPETSSFYQGPLGNLRLSGSPVNHIDFVSHFLHGGATSMDVPISFRNVGLHNHHQRGILYHSRGQLNMVGSFEHPGERIRSHRNENNSIQADNRKQYELDIGRIRRGDDNRTTLMIKNIPNKYTSKMLMATIDERLRGTYDFIYLPIDFKNKCNVGYAFINMVDPNHIIPLFEMLNGKKWEKFNSEKVASLAYARIQGKAALVSHFQNSSLMNEDKRCRPILFQSDGSNAGDQVPFPMGANIQSRSGKSRSINDEDGHNEGLPNSVSKEVSCRD